jgi:hypothetical protein
MEFTAPAGTVVYTTDPKLMAKLAGDKNFIIGRDACRRADAAWTRYQYLRFGNVPTTSAPLFLGTLRSPKLGDRLVVIGLAPYEISKIVIEPRLFHVPLEKDDCGSQWGGPMNPMFKWITYYQGATDPADASRFVIPFDSDRGPGQLVGHLADSGWIDWDWVGQNLPPRFSFPD